MKKVVRFVMPQSRQHRFPRARSSVGAARALAVRWLADWGYVERLEDIRLCVSELAANAVLHGVPPGREFSLEADADGPLLRIGVRDSGGGLPEVAQVDVDMCSGRGLRLVTALADDFGVTAHCPGKTVWVAFKAGCPRSLVNEGIEGASRRQSVAWRGVGAAGAHGSEGEAARSVTPMVRAAASWFLAQQALPRHQMVKLLDGDFRAHLAFLMPQIERLVAEVPGGGVRATLALAGVEEARRRLAVAERPGLRGEVERVQWLARSVMVLRDHHDALTGGSPLIDGQAAG
ncbi:DUF6415 family natural product biosynthesis protein [Streptomyces antibioticus]|uniref:DUF6415 family natural product biosynthesis protein n=1 Tax=Streptomyces antibioticus TaxID=1890 RepID=UPI0033A6F42C